MGLRTKAMDFAERLGRRIQQMRRGSGITQEALAARAKIKRPTLSRIENGEDWIRIDTLEGICRGLGVQPWLLLSGVEIDLKGE